MPVEPRFTVTAKRTDPVIRSPDLARASVVSIDTENGRSAVAGMNRVLTVVLLLAAVACGGGPTSEEAPGIAAGISADTLLAATEMLASDEFEGRAPGSEGETKTVAYLTEQFSALGLTPGNPDGTWVQDVPLVGITPLPGDNLVVTAGGESRTLEPAVDYVAATKHVVDEVEGVGCRVRLRRLRGAGAGVRLGRLRGHRRQWQDPAVPGQRSAARRPSSAGRR